MNAFLVKPAGAGLIALLFVFGFFFVGLYAFVVLGLYLGLRRASAAFEATSEALLIGKRFGIDPTQLIDILNVSTGRNFHSELSMKDHVIGERYAAGFLLALAAKDVRIAAGLAAAMKIDAPMLKLSAAQLTAASEQLGPRADVTEAIKAWDHQD